MITLLAFTFALGVIIFVHEAGHLLVAKAFDTKVLAFSLGFGRRLFGFRRGETDYRISLLPLGGYVKLGGEDPSEVGTDPREFLNKPRWQRFLIYLAGPVMRISISLTASRRPAEHTTPTALAVRVSQARTAPPPEFES